MVSIKIKLRHSSVSGVPGTVVYVLHEGMEVCPGLQQSINYFLKNGMKSPSLSFLEKNIGFRT